MTEVRLRHFNVLRQSELKLLFLGPSPSVSSSFCIVASGADRGFDIVAGCSV